MKLEFKKNFQKNIKKLSVKIQEKARKKLKLFIFDPFNGSFRRHKLNGKKYKNCESLDVTGDIRIIINEKNNEVVDIIDIGSHSYLY